MREVSSAICTSGEPVSVSCSRWAAIVWSFGGRLVANAILLFDAVPPGAGGVNTRPRCSSWPDGARSLAGVKPGQRGRLAARRPYSPAQQLDQAAAPFDRG